MEGWHGGGLARWRAGTEDGVRGSLADGSLHRGGVKGSQGGSVVTTIVQQHLRDRPNNKLLGRPPPDIDKSEETLARPTRRRLAQLRTEKSPLLRQYLHKIDPTNYPTEDCPLCRSGPHDTRHLFTCTELPTDLTLIDLWANPRGVGDLLAAWEERLG